MATKLLKLTVWDEKSKKTLPAPEKVDSAELRTWLRSGDGHTVYAPEYFTKMGFSTTFIQRFNVEQGAGATCGKDTIFDKRTGKPVVITAVYGLSVMRTIADAYDIYSQKLGRGSEAQDLGEQLIKRLKLK